MKKIALLLILLVCVSVVVGGCGVNDTHGDRLTRYQRINENYARQFVDDWDTFWLYDHNSHLSEWYPRVAY
ncbi:MAG: hypothetical protein KGY99_07200 [Phycisphaerae bacterium]|nr:hypothetical protein [Phycisphaerae bacterium]